MSVQRRYTSADLDLLPDVPGTRYEIIDGELFVSKQPTWHHQRACSQICAALTTWNNEAGLGEAVEAPGLVFAEDNDVAPDVVWISNATLQRALDSAGHLTIAPELIVEVLSPGTGNERRDREAKLRLYSRQGVEEYWIVDWRARTVEVYRRDGDALKPVVTLTGDDALTTPLLSGFSLPITVLWERRRRPS